MNNLPKIKKLSKNFHFLISALLVVIPLYYIIYWVFINSLPETLITKNIASASLVKNHLSIKFQLIGFVTSLFPLSALFYGLVNIRKLFSFYKEGVIFSFEHVKIFKKNFKSPYWVGFLINIVRVCQKRLIFNGKPARTKSYQCWIQLTRNYYTSCRWGCFCYSVGNG